MISDAVMAVTTGSPWPKDVGKKAVAAYTDALAPHAETAAVLAAEKAAQTNVESVREVYREDALEALGGSLTALMDEVRTIVARSGRITDGDAAITAGGTAVEDYATLTRLVGRLENIRQAQRSVMAPIDLTTPTPGLADAYRNGHDEVTGLRADPAPAHIVPALLRRKPRGVEYLIWLAESGRAWVPTSEADLLMERRMPDIGVPDGPVRDMSPRVVPIQAPPAVVHHAAERTPDLQLTMRNN
ncbi:hypothetical protein ACFZAM_12495 [Streptomyces sp. NPDC008079]|uniref:hypothetical protein n=1 Tax=Streptomyces sp. NPDC008079 TaxID=3364806 RepID=UPI0036ED3281